MPDYRNLQCLHLLGTTACLRRNDNRNMDSNGCMRKNNSFSIQRYNGYACTTGGIYNTTSGCKCYLRCSTCCSNGKLYQLGYGHLSDSRISNGGTYRNHYRLRRNPYRYLDIYRCLQQRDQWQQNHYGNAISASNNDCACSYYHSLWCHTNIIYLTL